MTLLFDPFPRSLDAFGRYRVSSPETIFDSKQIADTQPLFWDDVQTSGAGTSSTYNTNQASTTIAVANLTAGTRVRQTFRSFAYQPGKSQLIFMTFVFGAGTAGITRRVGQFNTRNGLFFQQVGTTLAFVRRTFTSGATVDNVVTQLTWNLDTLDGTGPSGNNPSGIALDPSKVQILAIDYEWLGSGTIRFGFVLDGQIVYAHRMSNANVLSIVYMGSPNLPLHYEIVNDGTGPAAGLVHICTTVMSEGGRQPSGADFGVARGATSLVTLNDADLYPLVSIRLQAAYQFTSIIPTLLSVLCTSTAAFRWTLLLNPTVVGLALVFTPIANSAVEADVVTANTTKVTGGTQINTGYGAASQQSGPGVVSVLPDLQIGASVAGVSDILVLAVQRISGATETFFGALSWHEEK